MYTDTMVSLLPPTCVTTAVMSVQVCLYLRGFYVTCCPDARSDWVLSLPPTRRYE
jgi:hypothetical protein